MIAVVEKDLRTRLGENIFGTDDCTLEGVTLDAVMQRGWTLACLEVNLEGALLARFAQTGHPAYRGGSSLQIGSEALATETESIRKQFKASSALGIAYSQEDEKQNIHILLITPHGEVERALTYGGHPGNARRWAVNMALDMAAPQRTGGRMMPKSSSKSLGRIVIGFWVLNLVVGILVISRLVAFLKSSGPGVFYQPHTLPYRHADAQPDPDFHQHLYSLDNPDANAQPKRPLKHSPPHHPHRNAHAHPIQRRADHHRLLRPEDRPLEVYRFGTGPTERLIVAGMHGGSEYNTIQLADLLIAYLKGHPEIVPSDVSALHFTRPEPRWRSTGTRSSRPRQRQQSGPEQKLGCQLAERLAACQLLDTTYVTGGKGPGSEPETKALMTFIQSHHFDALINYHSAALGIFAGGLPPDDYSIRLAKAVAAVPLIPTRPVNSGCMYTGGLPTGQTKKHRRIGR